MGNAAGPAAMSERATMLWPNRCCRRKEAGAASLALDIQSGGRGP